jgi:hypothetical protein
MGIEINMKNQHHTYVYILYIIILLYSGIAIDLRADFVPILIVSAWT